MHIDDVGLPGVEKRLMERWGNLTTLDAPLIYGGEVIGVLGLTETHVRHYTESERELFARLAVLAATAIHSAMAVRRLEEQNRYLASLLQVSSALVSGTPDDALQLMAREAAQALGAAACIIYELDSADECLRTRAVFAPSSGYITERVGVVYPLSDYEDERFVITKNQSVVRTVSDRSLGPPAHRLLSVPDAKTLLKIPLAVNHHVVGLMVLVQVDVERHFAQAELDLACAIGHHVAAALEPRGEARLSD